MIRKIIVILFSLIAISTKVFAETVELDKNSSKINYSLSCLGITFKRKSLPVTGQIDFKKEPGSGSVGLSKIDLTAKFTSHNPLFKKAIDYNRYPYFNFRSALENLQILSDKKDIELNGTLYFHGVEKKVKIKLKNKLKKDSIQLIGFLNILMTDFGIVPPKILFIPVDDLIKTKIEINTQKSYHQGQDLFHQLQQHCHQLGGGHFCLREERPKYSNQSSTPNLVKSCESGTGGFSGSQHGDPGWCDG